MSLFKNGSAPTGQAAMAASIPVVVASDQTAVPVSGTVTANAGTNLNTSALATTAKQDTLLAELQLKADLTETQPVSAASLPLPTGAATEATLTLVKAKTDNIPAVGQALMAASTPVTIASNQPAVPVSGTVTANLGTIADVATQTTLALIKAKTDNIPALGQALAATSTPVVLTALQETALTAKGVIYDVDMPLVTGLLTADGVQYSTEVSTTTVNANVDVLNVTIDPSVLGSNTLIAIEFGLTAEFRAVSTITADLIWKWQARNFEGAWVDLHAAVTETDINTTYVSRTRQGKFLVQANLNQAKIDIRLLLQCNEADQGIAKVNSSSYVRLVYV